MRLNCKTVGEGTCRTTTLWQRLCVMRCNQEFVYFSGQCEETVDYKMYPDLAMSNYALGHKRASHTNEIRWHNIEGAGNQYDCFRFAQNKSSFRNDNSKI